MVLFFKPFQILDGVYVYTWINHWQTNFKIWKGIITPTFVLYCPPFCYPLANEVVKGYSNTTFRPSVLLQHPCEHPRINILQWMLTKLGTYLVLKRIWNPIDFQGQRSRSPGQILGIVLFISVFSRSKCHFLPLTEAVYHARICSVLSAILFSYFLDFGRSKCEC
jgi:hypothetical protein